MKSAEGAGTSFIIKIPLTLAIVSALIVGVGKERFAIPQLDVRELVMVGEQSSGRIETINGSPFFRLRDRLLPLIDLPQLLGLGKAEADGKVRYIAVIRVGAMSFGMIVDKVFDTEEIVVKPVTSLLRHLPVFSGNTILGDGHVIMILDPAGIMKLTGIANANNLSNAMEDDMQKDLPQGDEIPLLLFQAGGSKAVKAVPLKHVTRLEEIDLAKIEQAGGQRVIQYLDKLMPIFLCGESSLPPSGRRPVIVFSTKSGLAGIVVDKIFDITKFYGEFQIKSEGALAGSAIIQGHATDIIDLSFHERLHDSAPKVLSDLYVSAMQTANGHGAHA
jgi:two-component system chemotaxis sensor kinase CheA